jgi:hypothetical protein
MTRMRIDYKGSTITIVYTHVSFQSKFDDSLRLMYIKKVEAFLHEFTAPALVFESGPYREYIHTLRGGRCPGIPRCSVRFSRHAS